MTHAQTFFPVPAEELPRLSDDLIRVILDPTTRVLKAEQRGMGDNAVRGVLTSLRFRAREDGTLPKERAFLWSPDGSVVEADTIAELPAVRPKTPFGN